MKPATPNKKYHKAQIAVSSVNIDLFQLNLMNYVEDGIKVLSNTIGSHNTLFANSLPQRCLRHNDVMTLYCEIDREPLCVSCAYQSTEHKNHRVIPLKNATKNLTTDTQHLRNRMQKRIQKMQDVIRTCTQNIVKIERIYPQLCRHIEVNFRNLHERLRQKQMEQIKELFESTEKMRSNHLLVIEQYNKLIHYYIDNDPPVIENKDDDMKVYCRNILQTLLEGYPYKEVVVKPIDFFDYPQSHSEVFKEIEDDMIMRLETGKMPEILKIEGKEQIAILTDRSPEKRVKTQAKFRKFSPHRSMNSSFKIGRTSN